MQTQIAQGEMHLPKGGESGVEVRLLRNLLNSFREWFGGCQWRAMPISVA